LRCMNVFSQGQHLFHSSTRRKDEKDCTMTTPSLLRTEPHCFLELARIYHKKRRLKATTCWGIYIFTPPLGSKWYQQSATTFPAMYQGKTLGKSVEINSHHLCTV